MKRAFTLIELLIVVGIIAILAGMSVVVLSGVSSRSRDSSRKESLGAYQVSLEQYKTGTGSFLISTAGYKSEGWGRMTRENISTIYPSTSLADVLQAKGYLTRIETDPRLTNYPETTDAGLHDGPVDTQFTDDYFLVVCNSTMNQIGVPSSTGAGVQYALYARLETTPLSSSVNSISHTGTYCGENSNSFGNNSNGDGGTNWLSNFTYVVGSGPLH